MTPDVAQVQLVPLDNFDYDNYVDGGNTSFAPPPEGVYTAQAPIIHNDGTLVLSDTNDFRPSSEGILMLRVDPITIVTPEYKGRTVRFQQFSTKKYAKREGSQVLDFLRACGLAVRPKSNDEMRAACVMASGRTFKFALIWEAFNKDTKETTSGYENFPPDPQNPSKRLSYVIDPYDNSKKWYANSRVKYFISAVAKNGNGAA